jgi:hypothetical protein
MKPAATCPAGDPNVHVRAETRSIELISREERGLGFRLHAHIHITNVSADPVFVLGSFGYGAISLARTEAQASSCRFIYSEGLYPSRSPYWEDLSNALDHETPPADVIRRIEPNRYWEFDRDIGFGITKYETNLQNKNALDEIRRDPHVWLKVEILTWPINVEGMHFPGFGKSLQKKWKSQGHLIIENLETRPVELTLPLAIAKKYKDEGDAFLLANKLKDGVRVIPNSGGVQYKVLGQGDGPKLTETDTVVAICIGKTIDGKEIENRSNQRIQMPIGRIISQG